MILETRYTFRRCILSLDIVKSFWHDGRQTLTRIGCGDRGFVTISGRAERSNGSIRLHCPHLCGSHVPSAVDLGHRVALARSHLNCCCTHLAFRLQKACVAVLLVWILSITEQQNTWSTRQNASKAFWHQVKSEYQQKLRSFAQAERTFSDTRILWPRQATPSN